MAEASRPKGANRESSFEAAYRDNLKAIAQFAARKGAGQEAEDVAQEALLRMWQQGDGFKYEEASRWLYTVTRNIIIDKHRKQELPQVPLESCIDFDGVCDDGLERIELDELVEQGLGFMSPPQRETMEMAFLKDYSYSQVATETDVQIGTVKSRVYYATRAARLGLEGLGVTVDVLNY